MTLPVLFFAAGAGLGWALTGGLLWAARATERRGTVPAGLIVLMMTRSLLIVGLFVAAGLQGLWAGHRAGMFSALAAVAGYLLVRRLLARSIKGRL